MKIGDSVDTDRFGKGTIKDITNDGVIVDFGNFEITFDDKSKETLRVV